MGTLVPVEAVIDLKKAGDCIHLAIQATSAGALVAVPTARTAATCAEYKAVKTTGLDANGLLLVAFGFLGKVAQSPKCLLAVIKTYNDLITPYVNKFNDLKCI
ncbi:hypothetical protein KR026_000960 [Drosophila bipectinata]|nr:hypothetical protein KR026_000960 [Drosophila bipectinata]